MAKHTPADFIDSDDEAGIEIDLAKTKPSRKFAGSDDQLIDAETGESEFDDITPALRKVKAEEPDDLDEDEDQDEDADDEEEPARVVADEDEEDEIPKRRGGKFQSRLEREQRLKREAREESAELRARLERLERGAELGAAERQFSSETAALQGRVKTLSEQLEKAIEDGESAEQVRLQNELGDLKVELRAKQLVFEGRKKEVESAKDLGPSGDKIVQRKVGAWKRQHPRYNTDKSFEGFVKGVDKELVAEGFDAESDEFYDELDRRIKKRYPEEYRGAKGRKTEEVETPRRRAPSQQAARDSAPARRNKDDGSFVRSGSKVRLSARQVRNMRQFGLDPTDIKDVTAYIRENS